MCIVVTVRHAVVFGVLLVCIVQLLGTRPVMTLETSDQVLTVAGNVQPRTPVGIVDVEMGAEVEKIEVVAFSDVHGWTATGKSSLDAFKASRAGKALLDVTSEEGKNKVLIYGGDLSTIMFTRDSGGQCDQYINLPGKDPAAGTDHCGCSPREFNDTKATVEFILSLKHAQKIILPGNHDTCLDFNMVNGDPEFAPGIEHPVWPKQMDSYNTLMQMMAGGGIHFADGVGVFRFKYGSSQKTFTVAGAGYSEGREPNYGKSGRLGAFQYFGGSQIEQLQKGYAEIVQLLTSAAELAGPTDLFVIHGPPDNKGVNFEHDASYPHHLWNAVKAFKPKLILTGHYHPRSDWKGGSKLQMLAVGDAEKTKIPMVFIPVKRCRPEAEEGCEIYENLGAVSSATIGAAGVGFTSVDSLAPNKVPFEDLEHQPFTVTMN